MTGNGPERRVSYAEAQVKPWLVWLARGMQHHGQTVFQLEQLQPTWLRTRREQQLFIVATRLVWGVLAGLIFVVITGLGHAVDVKLSNGLVVVLTPRVGEVLSGVLRDWLGVSLIYGLIGGLVGGLIDSWHLQRRGQILSWGGKSRAQQTIQGFVSAFFIYGVLGGLIYGTIVGFDKELSDGTKQWLVVGLVFGLAFGLIRTTRGALRDPDNAIQPVESVRWSWASAAKAGFQGLIVGLIFGLLFGLIFGLVYGLVFIPIFGLAIGLIGVFLLGLIGGFKPGIREMKTVPNRGIRLSLQYAGRYGVLAGLIVGLPFTLITRSPGLGLAYGLLAGIALGMYFGGLEVVEHGILRVIMAAKGYAPLKYVRFLDYAAEELNFLQKVGGGYVFIHRYLLEYFSALEVAESTEPAGTIQTKTTSS